MNNEEQEKKLSRRPSKLEFGVVIKPGKFGVVIKPGDGGDELYHLMGNSIAE